MDRDDEPTNPDLDEVVEEAADEAATHGISRQDAEKRDGDDDDVSPKDGAAM